MYLSRNCCKTIIFHMRYYNRKIHHVKLDPIFLDTYNSEFPRLIKINRQNAGIFLDFFYLVR